MMMSGDIWRSASTDGPVPLAWQLEHELSKTALPAAVTAAGGAC